MRAGRLRHRVTLQVPTQGVNTQGGRSTTYANEATRWAAVEPVSGNETVDGEAVAAEVTHKVTLRYYDGLTSAYRITHDNRTFEIVRVLDWQERHADHLLLCKELLDV